MSLFCWHKWTEWEEYKHIQDIIVGYGMIKREPKNRIRRMCLKCGKKQDRDRWEAGGW